MLIALRLFCMLYSSVLGIEGEAPNSKGRELCPNHHGMCLSGCTSESTMNCICTGNSNSVSREDGPASLRRRCGDPLGAHRGLDRGSTTGGAFSAQARGTLLLCEGLWGLPPVSVGLCAAGHSRAITTHAPGLSAPDIDLNPHECCRMPDGHRSARRARLPADVREIGTDKPLCCAAR